MPRNVPDSLHVATFLSSEALASTFDLECEACCDKVSAVAMVERPKINRDVVRKNLFGQA